MKFIVRSIVSTSLKKTTPTHSFCVSDKGTGWKMNVEHLCSIDAWNDLL